MHLWVLESFSVSVICHVGSNIWTSNFDSAEMWANHDPDKMDRRLAGGVNQFAWFQCTCWPSRKHRTAATFTECPVDVVRPSAKTSQVPWYCIYIKNIHISLLCVPLHKVISNLLHFTQPVSLGGSVHLVTWRRWGGTSIPFTVGQAYWKFLSPNLQLYRVTVVESFYVVDDKKPICQFL